ncbi:hypothetical protein L6164_015307 [Bauhinia variegata]|uniref:Uncharacterized protein n=1 Tax=Bauhinia variegata TaxID=167791 RepID=A0ACB9NM55_BAUVA|nr:hypothetical protein L6164_015307 [Bauhinia variegata]
MSMILKNMEHVTEDIVLSLSRKSPSCIRSLALDSPSRGEGKELGFPLTVSHSLTCCLFSVQRIRGRVIEETRIPCGCFWDNFLGRSIILMLRIYIT